MKRNTVSTGSPLLGVLLSFAALLSPLKADPSPTLIPFQGRLTDQQGQPYQTGQFTVTFNLYDQAIGGTSVWTERHEKVSVINGMINAFLGSINTTLPTVDFSTTKYLGIAVDADDNASTPEPEMVPRTMILAAFFAKKAQDSAKLAGAGWEAVFDNGNPATGSIAGGKIAAASVTSAQLAGGAVTPAQLADNAVTAVKIAEGSVDVNKLAADAVTSVKLADGAVTGAKVQDGSLNNADLAGGTASANLAAEGLIALSAAPIRYSASVATNLSQATATPAYTVPSGKYARVWVWGGTFTIDGAPNYNPSSPYFIGPIDLGPGSSIQSSTSNTVYVRGVLFINS